MNGTIGHVEDFTSVTRIHQKPDAIVDQVRKETSRVMHQIARREEILVNLLAYVSKVYRGVRSQLLFNVYAV